MPTTRQCNYRGHSITVRCRESRCVSIGWPPRFEASFSVNPEAEEESGWQQFPPSAFDTSAAATANALTEAKNSIDDNLTRN